MLTRKWQDKSGQVKYTTEIITNEIQMLDRRNQGNPNYRSDITTNNFASDDNHQNETSANNFNFDDLFIKHHCLFPF